MERVVKVNVYLKDMNDFAKMNEAYATVSYHNADSQKSTLYNQHILLIPIVL
jgi:enamine deaminase RidA (YjgF/YER057c/UK114 family)